MAWEEDESSPQEAAEVSTTGEEIWSSSISYKLGDLCEKDGQVYECVIEGWCELFCPTRTTGD